MDRRESKARQPELRTEKLERYNREFDIPQYDAEILTNSKNMADIFEETDSNLWKAEESVQLADGRDDASV